MKLKCQQNELLQALNIVQKAINVHNTLPILGNVLLRAEGQKLYLSATNLEIAISTSITADITNEGRITIPAKLLVSYVGFLKDGEVTMSLEDGETVLITSQGSKTNLKGMSPDDFPNIPTVEKEHSFSLKKEILKEGIEKVVFAASSSTTRPVLSGVYLWGKEGTIRIVATDSYRLAEQTVDCKDQAFSNELKCIIPARTMQELSRILTGSKEEVIGVVCSKNQILFKIGNTELISRLIEGKFPEYMAIIPSSSKITALTEVSELILAIKRVGLFARENNNNIKFLFAENKIQVTTDATEVGKEETEIPAETKGGQEEVALNGVYLLDVLQNVQTEKVQIALEGKLSPVVITPEKETEYVHVIMPLKV